MNAQKLMTLYALTALSFGVSTQAEARSYIVERFDTYTVRCSSIQASELPNKVIDTYDVREPSDDTGIISCVSCLTLKGHSQDTCRISSVIVRR
jgi:hypothetical protein